MTSRLRGQMVAALLGGAFVLEACSKEELPRPPSAGSAPASVAATPEPPPVAPTAPRRSSVHPRESVLRTSVPLTFPGGCRTHSEILASLDRGLPAQYKPVGTTSIVFRVTSETGIRFAYKPRSLERPGGFLRELAAFQLGQTLGLDNVAPVKLRSLTVESLRHTLVPEERAQAQAYIDGLIVRDGHMIGAAIYWVPDLHDLGLDREQNISGWRTWLENGEIPADSMKLARDLSNMLVFDYVIANWDRFSGGNLQGIDVDGERRLILRDHDASFAAEIPADVARRMSRRLEYTSRFSRQTVERLRALTVDSLDENIDEPALSVAQKVALLGRVRTVLSYVDALVASQGEQQALFFE